MTNLYRIFMTHNRAWTLREILFFVILTVAVAFLLVIHVHRQKIKKSQAIATLILFLFLGIAFASTVFTRNIGTRTYKLIPFWSWFEVIVHHQWGLLEENLLNVILFFPIGCLLPFVYNRSVAIKTSFKIGWMISATIETCQLIFCRGLFEWDDMIHNSLGCVVGCMIASKLFTYFSNKKSELPIT